MRRRPGIVLLALLLSAIAGCHKETVTGRWDGAIDIFGRELKMQTEFKEQGFQLSGTISIPQQAAQSLALSNVTLNGTKLHFELKSPLGLAAFDGEVKGNQIDGSFTQSAYNGTFHLARAA